MDGEPPPPALRDLVTGAWSLDRAAPAPAYAQIAERLVDLIESGRLTTGDRLPAERDLALWVGVSRMTARAALSALHRRGLIKRDVGRGTFVAPPKLEHSLSPLAGFTELVRRQGLAPTAEIRAVAELAAPPAIAERLGLEPAAPVVRVERLRLGDGEPLALEDSWIPAAPFPGLARHDLRGSVYALMREVYGTPPVRAIERLEPRVAEPHHAQALGIAPGTPLMLITRIAYAADGRAIEFAHDHYRGDRARFVIEAATPESAAL